jgi:hypothetical protein
LNIGCNDDFISPKQVKLDLMQKGSGRPREDQLEYEVIEIESDAT